MNSDTIKSILEKRIMLLDGGLGTQLQLAGIEGCPDLACLDHPETVREIHERYLAAGSDFIETDSFSANAISLEGYGRAADAYEIARAAASIARKAADKFTEANPEWPRFVVGSIGPTSKSATLAPLMDDPVTPEDFENAYYDQARGLVDGGADVLMLETMVDSLNIRTALDAIKRVSAEKGSGIPVMVSVSLTDSFGRLLSGESIEELYAQIKDEDLLSVGLNCSMGAELLLPFVKRLAEVSSTRVSVHPNAGLPNPSGGYDETPEMFAVHMKAIIDAGLVNIAGGCCGTTPEHIRLLAAVAEGAAPRPLPGI
ncbi:MAG: homocysteine S-methyltransferase family protein [Bacteroidales bacterium]|nr:homocysteine S-methyltransferase family protein [Bacteroidales bacterium]